MVKMLP